MITFTSSHRQNGKSVLAANLAFELAKKQKVCLLDGDFAEPSQHTYFSLSNAPASITALSRLIDQDRLAENDFANLTIDLVVPNSKVTLLAGNANFSSAEHISQSGFETLIEFLSLSFDEVVVDLAAQTGLTSQKEQLMLDRSSQIFVTCNADQISIGRLVSRLEELSQTVDFEKSTLVLNRVRERVLGPRHEKQLSETIERHTPFKRIILVPEDAFFDTAMLNSVPLEYASKKSPALEALRQMSEGLVLAN